jgi:hypothetical protein
VTLGGVQVVGSQVGRELAELAADEVEDALAPREKRVHLRSGHAAAGEQVGEELIGVGLGGVLDPVRRPARRAAVRPAAHVQERVADARARRQVVRVELIDRRLRGADGGDRGGAVRRRDGAREQRGIGEVTAILGAEVHHHVAVDRARLALGLTEQQQLVAPRRQRLERKRKRRGQGAGAAGVEVGRADPVGDGDGDQAPRKSARGRAARPLGREQRQEPRPETERLQDRAARKLQRGLAGPDGHGSTSPVSGAR